MTRPISSFHFVGMFFLLLGHYVVVCGYDLKKKKIFYKNPSYDEGKHYTYVKTIKVFLSLLYYILFYIIIYIYIIIY